MLAQGWARVLTLPFFENIYKGDLHPGNILVSSDDKFVLLDVGIVLEHSERDHVLISDTFRETDAAVWIIGF